MVAHHKVGRIKIASSLVGTLGSCLLSMVVKRRRAGGGISARFIVHFSAYVLENVCHPVQQILYTVVLERKPTIAGRQTNADPMKIAK